MPRWREIGSDMRFFEHPGMKLAGQSSKTSRTGTIWPEPAALARSLLKCHSFAKNGSKERSPVRRGIGYQVSGGRW